MILPNDIALPPPAWVGREVVCVGGISHIAPCDAFGPMLSGLARESGGVPVWGPPP